MAKKYLLLTFDLPRAVTLSSIVELNVPSVYIFLDVFCDREIGLMLKNAITLL